MTFDMYRPPADVSTVTVQPLMILPSQWFATRDVFVPERGLMVAVLADAVRCIEKYRSLADPRAERDFVEAQDWLLADDPSWPYSFERICAVLTLDADAVRERLRVAPAERQVAGEP